MTEFKNESINSKMITSFPLFGIGNDNGDIITQFKYKIKKNIQNIENN